MDSAWIYPVLFLTGTAAGFIDSIAGGGGLMTMPVLLSLLPATVPDILGTNKLQAPFGSGSATWHYRDAGLVELKHCWAGIIWTAIGAFAGTLLVQNLQGDLLRLLIPWLLVAIALYSLVQPKLGSLDVEPAGKTNIFRSEERRVGR